MLPHKNYYLEHWQKQLGIGRRSEMGSSERVKFVILVLLLAASIALALYVNAGFRNVLVGQ
jgi:hypothetical protein